MSRLTRDGTAKPPSRDPILGYERGQGNIYFSLSADHDQDWQPYPVDPHSAISDDHTYIHIYWCVLILIGSIYCVRRVCGFIDVYVRCFLNLISVRCVNSITYYFLYCTLICQLHINSWCGKTEAHKKWSMVIYLKRQHPLLELP